MAEVLLRILDEIDYGLLLLAANGDVLHANHLAGCALDGRHPLHLDGKRIQAKRAIDQEIFSDAIRAAQQRGVHGLIHLGPGIARVCIAVVPLISAADAGHEGRLTLLKLGRSQIAHGQAISSFSRTHQLSAREQEVLLAISQGHRTADIAQRLGLNPATIRSHVHSIKGKTGCSSIVDLLRELAALPSMTNGAALT